MKKFIISLVLMFTFAQVQAAPTPEVMAAIKHASPLPSLMMVTKKHGEQLNLSEEQKTGLAAWSKIHFPMLVEISTEIKTGEQAVHDAVVDGASKEDVMAQINELSEKRKSIASMKTDCRDNMRKLLNDEQWKQLVELYKGM
ncbi:MAG: hypothetical protein KAG43_09250 [Candidatus Marithrix sp.]|nr:hypothetical protein [Candidatus Marithrix sp.]